MDDESRADGPGAGGPSTGGPDRSEPALDDAEEWRDGPYICRGFSRSRPISCHLPDDHKIDEEELARAFAHLRTWQKGSLFTRLNKKSLALVGLATRRGITAEQVIGPPRGAGFPAHLAFHARKQAERWLRTAPGRDDPVFRHADLLRARPFLRTGRFLAVIAPFDPGAWDAATAQAIADAPNGLDAAGRCLIGLIALAPQGEQPTWRVPSGARSLGLAVTRQLVASRCRSGSIAGLTLTRRLFGPAREAAGSPELVDAPSLIVDLDGFVPLQSQAAAPLPGDQVAPARAGLTDLGGVFRPELAAYESDTADMPAITPEDPDWRQPLTDRPCRPFTRVQDAAIWQAWRDMGRELGLDPARTVETADA
ncbi:MAG: hypothetical protein RIB41_12255 [Oceanibaculum nanhaiense]|jgi:hypothetical protein|uniref:hypothetical protein n=1 Tax=Oceanibaculum nanhaiense TaxID=1909734 RepID=UPI0032EAB174